MGINRQFIQNKPSAGSHRLQASQKNRHHLPPLPGEKSGGRHFLEGFTLIEILLVMLIVGIVVSLTSPRLFSAYEKIRAATEEQKLRQIVENLQLKAFIRQVEYTVQMADRHLSVTKNDEKTLFTFTYISFPAAGITFNANGFASTTVIKYFVTGREKTLHVS
ncbi:MAG: hypothetical protein BZ151_07450 [Desulfobacca sp. 4484_104]|nr:MAG: hypothetical protein BZ151_07450 [Desulfobacca sp. 4484_104]RLB72171.1 MAG: hypothetical protein DRH04_00095 [Deltaproteobacteria bacterium]